MYWSLKDESIECQSPLRVISGHSLSGLERPLPGPERTESARTGHWLNVSPVRGYDVSSDGERFFVMRSEPVPRGDITELDVILNWSYELERLVPTEN